eukprot:GHVU01147284.1.p1 GENE.GHVU01147284.1~~GHVU01147284.1.p1  ORF type:complete len:100 (-),score=3.38 GHVU01147284.1:363-662(-)
MRVADSLSARGRMTTAVAAFSSSAASFSSLASSSLSFTPSPFLPRPSARPAPVVFSDLCSLVLPAANAARMCRDPLGCTLHFIINRGVGGVGGSHQQPS